MGVRTDTFLLLSAYLTSVALARYNPAELQNSMVSKSIRAATAIAFSLLALQLYVLPGGGRGAYPNILPLSAALALVHLVSLIHIPFLSDESRERYDNVSWGAAVLSFVGVAFYTISPPEEGWMRPTGFLLCICMALPLLFAAGNLANPSSSIDDAPLLERSLEASVAVYNKVRTTNFLDTEFVHDQGTGTRTSVASHGTDVFVSFSGSVTKTDWLKTNADAVTTEFSKGVQVHRGFLKAWESVKEKVLQLMADIQLRVGGKGRVIFCGHSLGGALASISALDVIHKEELIEAEKVYVVTFGSPPVGPASFANLFNSVVQHSARMYTVFDPVPKATVQFVHVKGGHAITTSPALDNPATAHNIETYESALSTPPKAAIVPAAIILVLLTLSACVPREHVESFAKSLLPRRS